MKRKPSFYIQPFAPAGLFLLFFAMEAAPRTAIISSVAVHEISHLIAARFCRQMCEKVILTPFGINLGFSPPKTYLREMAVALAGPIASFLFAYIGFLRGGIFGENVFLFSALFGIMNLIPLPSFDGYHAIYAGMAILFGNIVAEKLVGAVSVICLFLVWIISVYILFYSGVNFVLLVFSAYIFAAAVMKKECLGHF